MKNKKLLTVLGVTTLLLGGLFVNHNIKAVNAASADVETLNALVKKYYNEGVYRKETVINITKTAVAELNEHGGFHAKADDLIRVTKFNVDTLTMTIPGNETYESNYGTDKVTGALTHWSKGGTPKIAINKPLSEETAGKWRNWDEAGMEGYYWTVKDIVATKEQNWSVNNGVYSSSNETVIEWFKAIVAPCYVGFADDTGNYINFSGVEIQEDSNTLQLRLLAKSADSGKLTNSNLVFAQATISAEHTYHVYGTEEFANASGHYHKCIFCNNEHIFEEHAWDRGTMTRTSYSRVYKCECGQEKNEQKVRIYFTNNWNWSKVNVYCWDKNVLTGNYGTNASWPGVAATKLGKNDYNQDIYYYDVDLTKYDYIIFNGDKQTQDLDLYALGSDNLYYMEWNSTKGDHAVSTYYDGK